MLSDHRRCDSDVIELSVSLFGLPSPFAALTTHWVENGNCSRGVPELDSCGDGCTSGVVAARIATRVGRVENVDVHIATK